MDYLIPPTSNILESKHGHGLTVVLVNALLNQSLLLNCLAKREQIGEVFVALGELRKGLGPNHLINAEAFQPIPGGFSLEPDPHSLAELFDCFIIPLP